MARVCLYSTITLSLGFYEAISIGYEDATAISIVSFDIDDPPPSSSAMTSTGGNSAISSYPGSPGFQPVTGAGTTSIFANVGGVDPGTASLGEGGKLETGYTGVPNTSGGSAGVGLNAGGTNSRIGNPGTVTGVPGTTENANIGDSGLGLVAMSPGNMNSGTDEHLVTGTAGVDGAIGSSGTTENSNFGGSGLGPNTMGMIGDSGNINSGTGNLGTGSAGFGTVGSSGSAGGDFSSIGSENWKIGGVSTMNVPLTGNTASSGFGGLLNPESTGVNVAVEGFGIGIPTSVLGNRGSDCNGAGRIDDPGTGVIVEGSRNNGFGLPTTPGTTCVGGNPTSGIGTTRSGIFTTNPQLNLGNHNSQVSSNAHVIPFNIYATVYTNFVPRYVDTSISSEGSVSDRGKRRRSWRLRGNSSRRRGRPPPIPRRRARIDRRRSQIQSIRITIDGGGRISSLRRA